MGTWENPGPAKDDYMSLGEMYDPVLYIFNTTRVKCEQPTLEEAEENFRQWRDDESTRREA